MSALLSTYYYVFTTGLISPGLFYAIRTVETGGDANMVSKDGRFPGAYQIAKPYWKAAVEIDPSLTVKGQKYENCGGNLHYSENVMRVAV